MEALSQILLVVQIVAVVIMVAMILIQKSSSDGLTGNSSPTSFLSGRAQANLFTRITAICATIFLVNSLALAYLASHTERESEVIEEIISETTDGEAAKELTVEDARKLLDETSDQLNDSAEKIEEKADEAKEKIKKITPQVPVEE